MLLGGFLEFLLGNTFPFVLFCGYGSWWLSYGATLQPFYNSYAAYSPDVSDPAAGLTTVGFNASFGTYQQAPKVRAVLIIASFLPSFHGTVLVCMHNLRAEDQPRAGGG
jgi:hypothetical protein